MFTDGRVYVRLLSVMLLSSWYEENYNSLATVDNSISLVLCVIVHYSIILSYSDRTISGELRLKRPPI